MANDVFSIKNNVVIEFQIPSATAMTWGVSTWDNANWDSGTGSTAWTNLHCEAFDITIGQGCPVESGIFVQPSAGVATIKLQGADYDPFSNARIHSGTPIRIGIQSIPDTNPTFIQYIFQGTVRDFSAAYNQQGNNVITIQAVDGMQDFLNTRVASYTIGSLSKYPADVLTDLANTYYSGLSANILPDIYFMAAKTYTNVRVGDIVKDALIAGLGALYLNPDGTMQYLSEEDLGTIISSTYDYHFSTTHSTAATHICMTGLTMKADTRDLPNEIIATYTGGSQLTLRNQDAYDLYGAVSLDITVPIDDATGTQLWLDRLNLTTNVRRVQGLSFDAIKREGQLWDWINLDANHFFSPQKISYNLGGITFSETYFVTHQNHHITPDSWDIAIELWRGI